VRERGARSEELSWNNSGGRRKKQKIKRRKSPKHLPKFWLNLCGEDYPYSYIYCFETIR
jgi:hypothetical protein